MNTPKVMAPVGCNAAETGGCPLAGAQRDRWEKEKRAWDHKVSREGTGCSLVGDILSATLSEDKHINRCPCRKQGLAAQGSLWTTRTSRQQN